MYLGVKAVEPQANYMLLLTFENDEKRLFDMKPYLDFGPVFKALKDESLFRSVHTAFRSIEWANDADLDPEMLYPNSQPIQGC
jgi:hypothetical protein